MEAERLPCWLNMLDTFSIALGISLSAATQQRRMEAELPCWLNMLDTFSIALGISALCT